MPEFRIQRLRAEDWQRFRSIRLTALEDSPKAFGSTHEEELQLTSADWQARLERQDVSTFVAVSAEGRDVGLAVGAPYDDVAGLFSMWVAPSSRGSGIGGLLIDKVIAWAIDSRHNKILLDVGDYNTGAISLYQSKGFVRTGITGSLPPPRDSIAEHQRELLIPSYSA